MKRLMLGLSALLGAAIGGATVYGGGRGGGKRYAPTAYYSSSRPIAARWWHNDKDPAQMAAIQAAEAKQARKAQNRIAQAFNAWGNRAHTVEYAIPGGGTSRAFITRLNPFYIAK